MFRVAARSVRSLSTATAPHRLVEMPTLSPTLASLGKINWKAQPGDKLQEGDVLCEWRTEGKAFMNTQGKAVRSFTQRAESSGYLASHLVAEGHVGCARLALPHANPRARTPPVRLRLR